MPSSDKSKQRKRLHSSRDKNKNSMSKSERQTNQILTRKDLLKNGSKLILMLTQRMRRWKPRKFANALRKWRNLWRNSKENNIKASLRINRVLVILKPTSTELRIIILKLKSCKFSTLRSNLNWSRPNLLSLKNKRKCVK